MVRIPNGAGKYVSTTINKLDKEKFEKHIKHPTVIYFHGCAGVWEGTYTRINYLAKNGYAVIAPVSFARKKYPKSCNVVTKQGGLYRGTLKIRQFDAGFAIEHAKLIPWVDPDNVFLMGLSRGGITTATFSSKSAQWL